MTEMVPRGRSDRRLRDHRLRAALEEANVPTLLMLLVHLTGEERWLAEKYRPQRARPLDDNDSGGLPEEIQSEIRDAAFTVIRKHETGILEPAELSPDQAVRMLEIAMVDSIPREYGPLLMEELGIASRDVSVPQRADREVRALVIGAGISGLCAAIKLKEAGIGFAILEKNSDLGGTWLENTYPGVGVDTPSHFYSFSFSPSADWPRYFARGKHVYEYLARLTDEFAIRDDIRFDTEVVRADYDARTARWTVVAREQDGSEETLICDVLISAVGMLNRPAKPPIPGIEDFRGPVMHSAEWRDDIPLKGKRVAIVGTGASAMQLAPTIVDDTERLIIFQRSKQWAIPHPNYHREVPENVRLLMAEVPLYAAWYRLRAFWNYSDRLHPLLQVDPEWPHQDRSINKINERQRVFLTQHIKSELGDRTDLVDACVPTYPPFGKRPLVDNGWFRTVRRDDVVLVTEGVAEVKAHSVVTDSGREFDADVIVLATGFKALQFLWPMEIRGRSGKTLREQWGKDDARAYLGVTVPDFPNFFIINGPNTNAGHGGSAVIATELQVRYVMQLISQMIEHHLASVEVRDDVFWDYNKELDDALNQSIWVHPGMTTYYRNDAGRVVLSSPWKYIDYWQRTYEAALTDYRVETEPGVPAAESELDIPA